MKERTRIAIVDDHSLVRSGLVRALEKQADFEIIAEGDCSADAVRIAQDELPDIMLLDISMPGDGLNAARRISALCPAVKIIILTVNEDEAAIAAALAAGCRGYILKGVRAADLVSSLRSIAQGEPVVLPGMAARLLAGTLTKAGTRGEAGDLLSQLTASEISILQHLAQGHSNREIGEALGLSEKTIKNYLQNILQKLHVANRVAAVLLAEQDVGRGT